MSTTTDDGGPAFPVPHGIDGNWVREPLAEYRGMSLRDWFAGQALLGQLAGLLSDPNVQATKLEIIARDAYVAADAMLKARENKA